MPTGSLPFQPWQYCEIGIKRKGGKQHSKGKIHLLETQDAKSKFSKEPHLSLHSLSAVSASKAAPEPSEAEIAKKITASNLL